MNNTLRNLLAPLTRRVRLMITRAVITRVNDSTKCQNVQVELLSDEVRDDVEHYQDYGFTSHPHVDAEGIMFAVGGNRAHGVVVGVVDRRYRPKNMAEGDVCLYTAQGERVYLNQADDVLHLGAKAAADFVALAADVKSELDSVKADFEAFKSAFDLHTHVYIPGAGAPVPSNTPIPSAPTPHTPASVAATKVKAT